MDGIILIGKNKKIIYEFDVKFYGFYFYYCYISFVDCYIGKGLYGMFIVDLLRKWLLVDEMVLIIGGYDIN